MASSSKKLDLCPICLSDIQNLAGLPCGHIFCKKCIDKQLQIQSRCPICRRVFCTLIGEQYPIMEDSLDQSSTKNIFLFSKQSYEQLKVLSQFTVNDEEKYQNIPLIQQLSFKVPSHYSATTKMYQVKIHDRGIQAVNIALKSNLYLAFQALSLERYKLCDIVQITDIQKLPDGYHCELKKIIRAKILTKKEKIQMSGPDSFYIINLVKLMPINDDVTNQQENIFRLLQSISQKQNNIVMMFPKNVQIQIYSLIPRSPNLLHAYEIDNIDILTKTTNFSTLVIEQMMINNWSNLKINYQQNLTKRLQIIENILSPLDTNIVSLMNRVSK